ncbi:MAG TPA: hypothetical protein PLF40_21870, partial [Kofleriaceae bacterium]|nr:hypothetical protein [Kofleriaceae bacterium]
MAFDSDSVQSDPPKALGTTSEPPDRPSGDDAAETPAPAPRAKRSTLAERLAARMDAISAGRLDEDDDQLDGVDADLSVGDSTMTLDVEEAELTPPPQA